MHSTRPTMRTRVLPAAFAATLAVALAACGQSSTSSSGGGATPSAPSASALTEATGTTDITVWHGLGAANGVAFTKLIDQFNQTNTDRIHVTATYQGVYADLLAKYTATLRDNSAPTVMLAGDIATAYMIDVHHSLPAAQMAKANPGDVPLADLAPAALNYYSVNGVQQAVPMNVSTPMLWVNRDLLGQAGVDPASLRTLDGVLAAATTVKQKTGTAGFTMQDDDWYIEQLVATAGQQFCTPGNGRTGQPATAITINTGLAKENITKVADLYRSGVAVDGAPDGSAAIAAFQAGKVAMMLYSSGIAGTLKTGTPFAYQSLPFPTSGPAGSSGPVIGGSALWLSSTATPAQQVAGWKLEAYLTSAAAQEQFSHATGYIPINKKTADSPTQKTFLADNPNAKAFAEQLADTPVTTATSGCVSGAMTKIKAADISELQAAFAGQKTVDAALDTATTQAAEAMKQYQAQVGH